VARGSQRPAAFADPYPLHHMAFPRGELANAAGLCEPALQAGSDSRAAACEHESITNDDSNRAVNLEFPMTLILITAALMALVMLAMAVGVLFKNRCLRGSCGGPDILDPDGEPLSCSHLPEPQGNRRGRANPFGPEYCQVPKLTGAR
jgi:hypothetical protein